MAIADKAERAASLQCDIESLGDGTFSVDLAMFEGRIPMGGLGVTLERWEMESVIEQFRAALESARD